MTHRFTGYCIDLFLVAVSAVFALLIRENFETTPDRLAGLIPYVLACVAAASLLLPLFGTNRALWRLSTAPDYTLTLLAAIGVVMTGSVLGFAYNRLDGVARSLPLLHAFFLFNALSAVRFLARLRHERRAKPVQLRSEVFDEDGSTILIVGQGRLLEAYLRTFAEAPNARIKVGGLLCPARRLSGRTLVGQTVLGVPEDISDVIRSQQSHNVTIDRVVIAMSMDRLAEPAVAALWSAQETFGFEIVQLTTLMGLDDGKSEGLAVSSSSKQGSAFSSLAPSLAFSVDAVCEHAQKRRHYWIVKRIIDCVAASLLVLVLSPFILVASGLALIDVGRPLVFWQRRPGLAGRMMRVYKFRTMSDHFDRKGNTISESDRVSAIGNFMRRSRLDELPQLLAVISGAMSIIGPRPLLPTDQAPEHAARLVVRPGVSGWAQVQGGRSVSPADKAALDVWYILNASIWLDIKIVFLTIRMLVIGETENPGATEEAWRDLVAKGVCTPSATRRFTRESDEQLPTMLPGASPAE